MEDQRSVGRGSRGMLLRILVLLGAGQVLGPAMDQIHVQTGTLWYDHPALLEQAIWVGPQFAVAFVLLDLGARMIAADDERRRARRGQLPSDGSRAPMAVLVATFVGAYLTTGLLHDHELLVVVILAVAFAARVVLEQLDRADLLLALGIAAGGTTYEAVLVHVPGAFSYVDGSMLFGVPLWLPLLYAHGAPALMRASRRLPFGAVAPGPGAPS